MRNRWIRSGCFLTGINYEIIRTCSEAASKRIMRYAASLIMIVAIWGFVGYTFTDRYIASEWYFALAGMMIMMLFAIQVERQIILATHKNKMLTIFRAIVAIVMAVIGSMILDQIIFKEDIAKKQLESLDADVDKLLPGKSAEIKRLISEIDSTVLAKERERGEILADVLKNPTIQIFTTQTTSNNIDSVMQESVTKTRSRIENPKIALIQPLDAQIAGLRIHKMKKDSILLSLRPAVEAEIREHVGFLDELKIMMSILSESGIALFVWVLLFTFLLGIELFVLVSKFGESDNDYDMRIRQQMEIHLHRVRLLDKQTFDYLN